MTAYISLVCLVVGLGLTTGKEVLFGPETWAVLVSGSNGWDNYRHQADVCHAYHSLLQKGVKKERIITLMYDDVAYSEENPTKGILVNRPGGPDVYNGVFIDYKGNDVNPKNFLNILEGNEKALKGIGSGRVLKSTKNDTVFVNFADHGATGVLCFPNEYLHAKDFIKTLNKMSKKNIFRKLILYIEACESGSIFDGLINHLKDVFVSTAAASDESSYAFYCDDEKYGTCLGDFYSVKWMERLDKLKKSESLFDNYNELRTAVNLSHVQVYGDYRDGFLQLFDSDKVTDEYQTPQLLTYEGGKGVNSRDIPLYFAKKALDSAKDTGSIMLKKQKLEKIVQARGYADSLISKILEVYTGGDIVSQTQLEAARLRLNLDMLSCHDELIKAFDNNCFSIPKNTYFLKHLYKFANICVQDRTPFKALRAIKAVCADEVETINELDFKIE